MRTFHVAQVCIHHDVSRDSDVQPTLKNLVMPSPNYDGSDVVLFLDETSVIPRPTRNSVRMTDEGACVGLTSHCQ